MKTLSHVILLTFLALASTAQGQTVYRCGNSYSQQPCEGARAIEVDDRRTEEQRKTHEAGVKQERKLGNELEKDRLRQEAAAVRAAQEADRAERSAAAKAAQQKQQQAKKTSGHGKDKIPAYRTPPPPRNRPSANAPA